jgi:hypothetical protein
MMDRCYYNQNRYFTMMTNVSNDVNREEILSLLNANSTVASLNLFQIYQFGKLWQRIGLVKVNDCESVFRLSSRQYLLKGFLAARHKVISPHSKLVKHFNGAQLIVHLNFNSALRDAVQKVVGFFEQFGELKISSIKSKDGVHEIILRAALDFSIRQVTTDTKLRVGDIVVDVHYPEEKIGIDYFSEDSELMEELQFIDPVHQYSISQRINYFNPSYLDSISEKPMSVISTLMATEYIINDEDDDLSVDSNRDEHLKISFSSRKEATSVNTWNDPSPMKYFNGPRIKELVMNRYSLSTYNNEFDADLSAPESKYHTDHYLKRAEDLTHGTDTNQIISDEEEGKQLLNDMVGTQKVSRNRRRKRGGKKVGKSGNVAPVQDQTSKSHQSSINCTKKLASHCDGSRLLGEVWCLPSDYQAINDNVMPFVHAKWRRFVEIKDEMRKAKYSEYLNAKKKDMKTTISTGVDTEALSLKEDTANNEE